MTVNELVQELQRLDRPDLDVFIPCPHCCGQRGADFDLLDAEHVVRMERDGGQVGLLGDTRQQCLEDRRSDSRLRVRKAATGHAPAIAAGLALQYVRTLALTDTERISVEAMGGHIVGSRFRSLRNPELAIIEATDGQDTHYVMVETPFRALIGTGDTIAIDQKGRQSTGRAVIKARDARVAMGQRNVVIAKARLIARNPRHRIRWI